MIQDDDNTILRTTEVVLFLNKAQKKLKNCFTTLSSNNDYDYPAAKIQYIEPLTNKVIWSKLYVIGIYKNVDVLIETIRKHIMIFIVSNDDVNSIDSRKFTITIF